MHRPESSLRWSLRLTAGLLLLSAATADATPIAVDDFQSYAVAAFAPDPLDGPDISWSYIDGQGDGIQTNDHRIFDAPGGGGGGLGSRGWVSLEEGAGLASTISLSALAGSPVDNGGGGIIDGSLLRISFVAAAETSTSDRLLDFTYSIADNSAGSFTFDSGGSADGSVTFTGLSDSGDTTGGTVGKTDRRSFSIDFTTTGVSLTDTLDFSFVRNAANGPAFVYFDDFLLESVDAVELDPRLTIDRDTESVVLINNTADSRQVLGYSLLSNAGGLDPDAWTPIAGNRDAAGDGSFDSDDNWTIVATENEDLSEIELEGGDGGPLGFEESIDFGNIWLKSPVEDIELEVLLDDGTILTTAGGDIVLEYTGNGDASFAIGDIAGDGEGGPDGSIDIADWLKFRANVGTDISSLSGVESYRNGNLNFDDAINAADFRLFVREFDAANGNGAFAAMVGGVPEPASLVLLLGGMAAAMVAAGRTRRLPRIGTATPLMVAVAILLAITAGTSQAVDIVIASYDATVGNPQDAAAVQNPEDQDWLEWGLEAQGQVHDPELVFQEGIIHNGQPAWRNFDNGPTNPGYLVDLTTENLDFMFNFGWRYELVAVLNQGGHFNAWGVSGGDNPWGVATRGRIGVSITSNGSDMTLTPVAGGGAGVTVAGGVGGDFVSVVLTGEPGSTDFTFEVFDFDSGTQIGTTQDLSGFGGSNSLNDNRLGLQSGSSGGIGRELFIHSMELVVPEPMLLSLEINTGTGATALINDSGEALGINGYFIESSAGQLNPAGWNSLEDQDVDGNGVPDDGIGWEEFDASSATFLGEGNLTGETTIANGGRLELGSAFDASAGGGAGELPELTFEYTDAMGRLISSSNFGNIVFVGGFAADFDKDGDVDGDDFLIWQQNFGTPSGATPNDGDANGDGAVNGDDFLIWQQDFGSGTDGNGGAAIPEPGAALLAAIALATIAYTSVRKERAVGVTRHGLYLVAIVSVTASSVHADAFLERDYTFGDDPLESAVAGGNLGENFFGITVDSSGVNLTAFPGAVNTGAFQDLEVFGSPTYVDVGPGGLARPGAPNGALGASFDGSLDVVATPISVNSPSAMWDNLPDGENPGFFAPPFTEPGAGNNPAFPHNLDGIFGRAIQLWTRPDGATQDVRQDLIRDTAEHGVFISDTNTWGSAFDNGAFDSGVAVAFDSWTHIQQISGTADLEGGGTAFGGALLVNGIAVDARAQSYDNSFAPLSIGGNVELVENTVLPLDNYFAGVLDDVQIVIWGDNSNLDPAATQTEVGYLGGANWGSLDLAADNDWIAQQLDSLGVNDPADVDLDGGVDQDDVTKFVADWRTTQVINGLQVGDWNSRQSSDLNYDGIVNLADAFILHGGLLAAGQGGLDFSLLGDNVPEPGTATLVVLILAAAHLAARPQSR